VKPFDAAGNPHIDGDLCENCSQFVLGEAAFDSVTKIQFEFVHSVQRRDHRQIDHQALFLSRVSSPQHVPQQYSVTNF